MKVLSFDPSGNYNEGKGTSGYSLTIDDEINILPSKLGEIKATEYTSRQAYWAAHRDLIEQTLPDVCVIESYRLFGHKSKEQIGSSLETPQLIGYLEMICYDWNIPVVYQDPSTKSRHSDDVLTKSNVVDKRGTRYYYKGELTNLHMRDAMRHGLYYSKRRRMKK